MALSNEDLPPAWLRDYATIEADIGRMEEFAAKLDAEVRNNFAPHVDRIYDDMSVELPDAYTDFPELLGFLEAHKGSVQDTADLIYFYREATGGFATAAGTSKRAIPRRGCVRRARVNDVNEALDATAAAAPPPGGGPQMRDVDRRRAGPSPRQTGSRTTPLDVANDRATTDRHPLATRVRPAKNGRADGYSPGSAPAVPGKSRGGLATRAKQGIAGLHLPLGLPDRTRPQHPRGSRGQLHHRLHRDGSHRRPRERVEKIHAEYWPSFKP